MAESGIIREFLVALGFKVDAAGQKKFEDGVENSSKKVKELAKANEEAGKSALKMGAAILSVGYLVGRSALDFAGKLEDLHFAAKRTGAAASSLKAMANAAADVGVTAQEALSSVEGVARFMRNNPAGESYISSLGVQTRKANGELRDTVDIVNDLGKELSKRPQYLANQLGQVVGINENHLLGMRNQDYFNEYGKSKANFDRSGVDSQSETAHGAMKWWRDLKENVEGTLGPAGSWATGTGLGIGGSVLGYFAAKSAVQQMIGKAVGSAAAAAAAAPAAASAAGAAGAAGEAAAAAGAAGAAGAGAAATPMAAAASRGLFARFLPWAARIGGGLGLMLYSGGTNEGEEAELERRRGMGATVTPAGPAPRQTGRSRLPRGIRNNNPGNINFAGQPGAAREEGPGGRFAVFQSAEQGLEALAVQLKRYANAGMDTIRAIITKYAPAGENNTEAYIANIARKFGVKDTDRLDFTNKETLANMMTAITQFENGQNPYTRDQVVAAAAKGVDHTGKFGGGQVKIEQKTEINLYGVSDARAAGSEVERRQRDVNRDMTRNLQGALS